MKVQCDGCGMQVSGALGKAGSGPFPNTPHGLCDMKGCWFLVREAQLEPQKMAPTLGAKKYDGGKARFDLLPWRALGWVAKVLTYGTQKYSENNWQGVSVERYEAAMLRHYEEWRAGFALDEESGLPHAAHMACCALFILAIEHGLDPVREPKKTVTEKVSEKLKPEPVKARWHKPRECQVCSVMYVSGDSTRCAGCLAKAYEDYPAPGAGEVPF